MMPANRRRTAHTRFHFQFKFCVGRGGTGSKPLTERERRMEEEEDERHLPRWLRDRDGADVGTSTAGRADREDRVPRPSPSSFGIGGVAPGPPAPTVVTYGSPMGRWGYHVAPLGADGPNCAVRSGSTNDDNDDNDDDDDDNDDNDDDGPRVGCLSVAAEEGRGTNARTAPRGASLTSSQSPWGTRRRSRDVSRKFAPWL